MFADELAAQKEEGERKKEREKLKKNTSLSRTCVRAGRMGRYLNGWVVGGRGGLVFYVDPVTKDVYQDKADNRVNW